jgi:hypothetical protein
MDVAQFKTCVTCTTTLDRYQAVTALRILIHLFQYKSQYNNIFNYNHGHRGFLITLWLSHQQTGYKN